MAHRTMDECYVQAFPDPACRIHLRHVMASGGRLMCGGMLPRNRTGARLVYCSYPSDVTPLESLEGELRAWLEAPCS
jgi:hypothetical protein